MGYYTRQYRLAITHVQEPMTANDLNIKEKRTMIHIDLPDMVARDAAFYLAMEEYVARNINADECFFTWQVGPSVIFGRHQLPEAELDIDYCRRNGINTFRRKSGGGCVYADMGNVMLSYITSGDSVAFTYNKYVNYILFALRRAGIEATASGRNDILVGGGKVSGTAFYHLPGRCIVHGTLLYDTDMENMTHALTPPDDKLQSKGVHSVRSRITLLKDHTKLSLDGLKEALTHNLCNRSIRLTPADMEKIKQIEAEYSAPEFIFGNNPPYSIMRGRRIEGAGRIEARIDLRGNTIRNIMFTGDFLPGDTPLEQLEDALKGAELTTAGLTTALAHGQVAAIRGLDTATLISILTDNT